MNTINKLMHFLDFETDGILQCDVILKCKDELFIGLYYQREKYTVPIVQFKGKCNFNFYLSKLAEMNGIPCVENQLLARQLYKEVDEGDYIPEHCYSSVSKIYQNLEKYKNKRNEESKFYQQLKTDALRQIDSLVKQTYQRVKRRYFRNKNVCNHLYEGDVVKYFADELKVLADNNELNYSITHNTAYKTDEFYLEAYYDKYDLDFWQIVFFSEVDKKIYVGTKTIYKLFDYSEAESALGFVKALVEAWKGVLWNDAQKFIEEFEINPRLFDIAQNSIRTMVEMNYNQNGYEYGFYFDKTCAIIYLKKREISEDIKASIIALGFQPKTKGEVSKKARKGTRMYEVLITYNEFLRHPDVFKDFIKEPKKFTKWNFWCKDLKYNQEKFEKKFQTKD